LYVVDLWAVIVVVAVQRMTRLLLLVRLLPFSIGRRFTSRFRGMSCCFSAVDSLWQMPARYRDGCTDNPYTQSHTDKRTYTDSSLPKLN